MFVFAHNRLQEMLVLWQTLPTPNNSQGQLQKNLLRLLAFLTVPSFSVFPSTGTPAFGMLCSSHHIIQSSHVFLASQCWCYHAISRPWHPCSEMLPAQALFFDQLFFLYSLVLHFLAFSPSASIFSDQSLISRKCHLWAKKRNFWIFCRTLIPLSKQSSNFDALLLCSWLRSTSYAASSYATSAENDIFWRMRSWELRWLRWFEKKDIKISRKERFPDVSR